MPIDIALKIPVIQGKLAEMRSKTVLCIKEDLLLDDTAHASAELYWKLILMIAILVKNVYRFLPDCHLYCKLRKVNKNADDPKAYIE